MKFYSDMQANLSVWAGQKTITFVNGVYETINKDEIEILKNYRSDKDGKAEQGNAKGQKTKEKQA